MLQRTMTLFVIADPACLLRQSGHNRVVVLPTHEQGECE